MSDFVHHASRAGLDVRMVEIFHAFYFLAWRWGKLRKGSIDEVHTGSNLVRASTGRGSLRNGRECPEFELIEEPHIWLWWLLSLVMPLIDQRNSRLTSDLLLSRYCNTIDNIIYGYKWRKIESKETCAIAYFKQMRRQKQKVSLGFSGLEVRRAIFLLEIDQEESRGPWRALSPIVTRGVQDWARSLGVKVAPATFSMLPL